MPKAWHHRKPGTFWEAEANLHWRMANQKTRNVYSMAEVCSSVSQLVLNRKALNGPKTGF